MSSASRWWVWVGSRERDCLGAAPIPPRAARVGSHSRSAEGLGGGTGCPPRFGPSDPIDPSSEARGEGFALWTRTRGSSRWPNRSAGPRRRGLRGFLRGHVNSTSPEPSKTRSNDPKTTQNSRRYAKINPAGDDESDHPPHSTHARAGNGVLRDANADASGSGMGCPYRWSIGPTSIGIQTSIARPMTATQVVKDRLERSPRRKAPMESRSVTSTPVRASQRMAGLCHNESWPKKAPRTHSNKGRMVAGSTQTRRRARLIGRAVCNACGVRRDLNLPNVPSGA